MVSVEVNDSLQRLASLCNQLTVVCTVIYSLCSVSINEVFVFDSMPSRQDVLTNLKIGAFSPVLNSAENKAYTIASESTEDVEAWTTSSSAEIGSMDTIFKVTDEFGSTAYFKNMKSDITIGGLYTVRNMPAFMNPTLVQLRDAYVSTVQSAMKPTFVF